MRTTLLLPLAAAGAWFTTACAPAGDADAFRSVLPDDRVLVNLNTDGAANARTGEWSEAYLLTAEVTDNVNGTAWWVLNLVDTVTDLQPTWAAEAPPEDTGTIDQVAQWGPYDGDALEPTATQLVVAHNTDDTYDWAIQQRPKADEAAELTTIIAGHIEAGATEEASRGAFAIDFGAAHALNPNADPPQGTFFLDYDLGASGVSAEAAFADFLDDNGQSANALYKYDQVYAGDGAMDLALESNMDLTSPAKEVLVVRSRWVATGAGRGDAYAVGGDLGEFVGTSSDCWGTDFKTSYYTDNYTDSGVTEGDVATCAFATPEYDDEGLELAQN